MRKGGDADAGLLGLITGEPKGRGLSSGELLHRQAG